MAKVQLLTFICSVVPGMPGHSAISIDQTIYTFEDPVPSITKAALVPVFGPAGPLIGPFIRTGTGWKQVALDTYVVDNNYRPIIFQDISKSVNSIKVVKYVRESISSGDLYGPDGACSTQTSKAISASLNSGRFNPRGIDTPAGVYAEVDRLGLASTTSVRWASPMVKGKDFFNKVLDVTIADYPKIFALDEFPKQSRA